jgi:hypothetical protein
LKGNSGFVLILMSNTRATYFLGGIHSLLILRNSSFLNHIVAMVSVHVSCMNSRHMEWSIIVYQ